MSEGRRNSIGTLTGWQLLAKQVDREQDGDSAADSSDGDDADAEADNSRQRLHTRTHSNGSNLSEESGLGGSTSACVTPRPHQWLYKEYKILDEIGSGGFGRVCRARRLADGCVVVVKEINTTSLTAKQKSATMDEVLVLSKLNHPNIVKYHDCYMDAVYINIVMEYCNAGDLAGLIKGRAGRLMPEEEVMSLFVQICLAMHYVHSAGVLHRDLKSSNVLITRADNFGGMPLLKLGDFGVAKMNSAESSMASTIVGTPQYLSPEMCDNKPYGKKSDVWALGCILYELCCLSKAFDIGTGGISGIILKIMRGTYEPLPAGYSDDLKGLVASMLQVKPRRRPGVMDVLNMPYVRRHLGLYLDWARKVPQAHPQVLLASLGELWPRKGGPHEPPRQQQQQQMGLSQATSQPLMLETIGSAGSCSSIGDQGALSPQQRQQQTPQQQQQQQLETQGSSPQGLYAASSRAATPASRRVSGNGSSSSFLGPASGSVLSSTDILMPQGSNVSAGARSGSVTPRSAAAAAPAAAGLSPKQLAPAGSNAAEAEQQQQRQGSWQALPPAAAAAAAASPLAGTPPRTSSAASSPLGSGGPILALSGPSAGIPPGSLSGWLGGDTSLQKRQQIQQQILAAHQHGISDQMHPQQQQQQHMAAAQKQQQQQRQGALEFDRQQADQLSHQFMPQELSPMQQQQQMQMQQVQQQQQQQQRISCPGPPGMALDTNTHLRASSSHSADTAAAAAAAAAAVAAGAGGWAYPSVSPEMRGPTSRPSLAQEQLEGLKAIWDLKAKLQIKPDATGCPGAGPLLRDFLLQQQHPAPSSSQQYWGSSTIAEADAVIGHGI